MPKEIPILKTGRYTDANGHSYDITQAMLDDMAKNTLPNSAPLVKGHPSADAPALGWVERLRSAGGALYAAFGKLAPEFVEELKAEAFRNVSASFYLPYNPSNPKQGHYVLRHVGALGAARPAIPGLGTLQQALAFAEQDDGIVALSENAPAEDKTLLEKVMALFSPDLSAIKEQLRQELLAEFAEEQKKEPRPKSGGGEPMPDNPRIAELEKQLAESNAALAKEQEERKRLASEAQTAQAKASVSAEVEKLGETKEIAPDKKEGLIANALALVGAGRKPAEAVLVFAEYLPDKALPARKNWGGRTPGKGLADFSEQANPAYSPEFALKKAEYEAKGLSPQAAYDATTREIERGTK